MVRLPWAIATVLMRTLAPITMVPLFEFLDHDDGGAVRLDPQILDHAQRLDRITAGEVDRYGAQVHFTWLIGPTA